jgi:hypothetical protein
LIAGVMREGVARHPDNDWILVVGFTQSLSTSTPSAAVSPHAPSGPPAARLPGAAASVPPPIQRDTQGRSGSLRVETCIRTRDRHADDLTVFTDLDPSHGRGTERDFRRARLRRGDPQYADTHWLLASRFPHIRWNRTGSDELLKRARVDRFDQISVKPCNLGPSAVLALRITGHRDQPGGSACRG